jgi:hypothetical protein
MDVAYVSVAIQKYCKRLFKVFHLFQTYVVNVLSRCCICCSCYTHMLQAYVVNVSPIFRLCCRSASCCNISTHRKQAHAEAVLTGAAVPTCAASEMGVGGPHLHARQPAWGAQLHVYVHQHAGVGVQAQQLHAGANMQAQQLHVTCGMRGRTCRRNSYMWGRLSSIRGQAQHVRQAW